MNVRELCSSCVFCCKKHVVGLKNFRLRGYSLTPKSRLSGAAKTSGYEHMRYLVVAPLICTALGTWQVARLKQKLEIIDKIQTRYHSDPVHLSEVHLFDGDTSNVHFNHVKYTETKRSLLHRLSALAAA